MTKYFRNYKRKNVRRFGRRKVAAKRRNRPSKFLKKTIQTMISKNIEDKTAFYSTGTSLVYFNSGINSNNDLYPILPAVSSGSTEQHRIGDTVRAKTLVIRGYIQLQKDQTMGDVANKRVAVRLMVVGSKRFKDQTSMYSNFGVQSAHLLNRGNTNKNFEGYINDLWTPINTEEFTKYYDRVFYLSQDYVAQQAGTTSTWMTWSQDISKGIKFFTIRIPVKGKLLKYDQYLDGTAPTNWTAGLCLGYAHLDGSAPDVVETRVGLCYDATFTYEDA